MAGGVRSTALVTPGKTPRWRLAPSRSGPAVVSAACARDAVALITARHRCELCPNEPWPGLAMLRYSFFTPLLSLNRRRCLTFARAFLHQSREATNGIGFHKPCAKKKQYDGQQEVDDGVGDPRHQACAKE